MSSPAAPLRRVARSGTSVVVLVVVLVCCSCMGCGGPPADGSNGQGGDGNDSSATTPEAPQVTLEVTPTSGQAPLDVAVVARATDGDGQIASVQLDWGDETAAFEGAAFPATLSHTYAVAGSYAVTATATDNDALEGTAVAAIQVSAAPSPAQLGVSPLAVDLGTDDTTASFSISNDGDEELTWSCSESESWLTIAPITGTNAGQVTVTVDRSDLDAGATEGTVTVQSSGGNATVTVTVSRDPGGLDVVID